MSTLITTGIVVKKLDFDDYDQVITIVTQEGKLSFIALGVRKLKSKNRIALELGNLIEIEYFKARLNNKLSKLKKAIILKQPPLLISDTANVILLIMKSLMRVEDIGFNVYAAFIESFAYFGENYNHHILAYLKIATLRDNGINPIKNKCVDCRRKDNISGFDLTKGGFTCNLHTKNELSIDKLKSWQKLLTNLNKYINVYPEINKEINFELDEFMRSNI